LGIVGSLSSGKRQRSSAKVPPTFADVMSLR
jgi:hypothetical protein